MMIDRLSIRTRPPGWPVMYQTWGTLLFLHWPVAAERLRPLLAPRLSLDTFEGQAWVSVTPFTMWGIRPVLFPPLPVVSQSHELNVRTYVHLDGVPGVWFFSLDASNTLAVLGARAALGLPYFRARMRLRAHNAEIQFASTRAHPGAPPARFEGTWVRGESLPSPPPDSLDFFLVERYCLYTVHWGRLYRVRIVHRPWPLRCVERLSFTSTMLESQGLPTSPDAPRRHAQGEPLRVGIWRLEKV
jgi:uncharacterized protein YqjF (DUF2071 family)